MPTRIVSRSCREAFTMALEMTTAWENAFLVTCAFLGDDIDAALAHLDPAAATRCAVVQPLRSSVKLERARAFASEIDAVKRALEAMEPTWR